MTRRVFKQVVEALAYLHLEMGVCHRDIKDENLVIDSEFVVKLIDFGAAAFIPTVSSIQYTIHT
jgi:serine/threonine protein kinase